MEQDKYIQEIVKLTKPLFFDCMSALGANTIDSNTLQHSVTPINNRRRLASKIEKAVQNFKPNFHLINQITSSSSSSHSSAQSSSINNNNNNNNQVNLPY